MYVIIICRKGNGPRTVGYEADGEASDWMLGKQRIIAASPELGTSDIRSNWFYIDDRDLVIDILEYNLPWVWHTFKKLGTQIKGQG